MTIHRGKIATHPKIISTRPLTRDDLACLRAPRPPQGIVKKLRDPHHRLARLVAMGLDNEQIIEHSGYSYTRIHQMRSDPAFQELVATIRRRMDGTIAEMVDEFYGLAISNMRKAETMLAEKLEAAEEEGTTLPTRDLIAISGDRMDRFGYGKRNTTLNINADFAANLEAARRRSNRVIEGSVIPPESSTLRSPEAAETSAHMPPLVPELELTAQRIDPVTSLRRRA